MTEDDITHAVTRVPTTHGLEMLLAALDRVDERAQQDKRHRLEYWRSLHHDRLSDAA